MWPAYDKLPFQLQVEKLVLINASVYAEGTGGLTKLPRMVAYGLVRLHKTSDFVERVLPRDVYKSYLFSEDSISWLKVLVNAYDGGIFSHIAKYTA